MIFWSGTVVDHAARSERWTLTLDKWIPFRNEGPVVRCRLFCFPHAGGNATFYRPLRRFMPPEVDFCPVELPGRAARLDELPLKSMSALMERLSRALQPLMGVTFGFFAHSVGAFMAFEAARQLRSVDGRDGSYEFPPLSAAGVPPKRRRIASKSRSNGGRAWGGSRAL